MVRNQRDFTAGLLFLIIGFGFAIGATAYPLGTTARVGAGLFPLCLGIFIAVLGVAQCFGAVRPRADLVPLDGINLKVTLCVLGGVVLFGASLYPLGFIGATLLLVVATSIASAEFRLPVAIATALCLTLGSTALFVWLLGLPLPLLPAFLS